MQSCASLLGNKSQQGLLLGKPAMYDYIPRLQLKKVVQKSARIVYLKSGYCFNNLAKMTKLMGSLQQTPHYCNN